MLRGQNALLSCGQGLLFAAQTGGMQVGAKCDYTNSTEKARSECAKVRVCVAVQTGITRRSGQAINLEKDEIKRGVRCRRNARRRRVACADAVRLVRSSFVFLAAAMSTCGDRLQPCVVVQEKGWCGKEKATCLGEMYTVPGDDFATVHTL